MVTVQEYLEKSRDYYNREGEIGIWGETPYHQTHPFEFTHILTIENFPTLKLLYVCGTASYDNESIEIIRIKNNSPHLETINLYRNNTEKITFEGDFSSVLYLDVSGNNLTELDLTPFPNLEHLDISNNLIESIDLSKCPKLNTFYCSLTPLKDLDLVHNKSLTKLWLTNDFIGEVVCKNNEVISISEDRLDQILDLVGKNLVSVNIAELNGVYGADKFLHFFDPEKLEELILFKKESFVNRSWGLKQITERFLKLRNFFSEDEYCKEVIEVINNRKEEKILRSKTNEINRVKNDVKELQKKLEKRPTPEELRDNQQAISSLESQLNQANSKSTKLAQEKAQLLQELTTLKANQTNFTPQEYQQRISELETKLINLETKLVQVEKEKAAVLNNLNNSQQERETNPQTNYVFWIGLIIVIGVIAYLLGKNNHKKATKNRK